MNSPDATGPADRDDRLGDAVEAYLALAETGAAPEPEAFAAHYPDLADDLRAALEGLALVQGLAGGPGRALEAGRRVAGYRIVRELGRGGMGIVYEAVHVDLDRPVALKVLVAHALQESSGHRRFLNEAKTAAGLHHTHIVPVFDVGQVGYLCYYAMQRIEGCGLDRVLRALRRDRTTAAGSGSVKPRPEGATAASDGGDDALLMLGSSSPPGAFEPGRLPDEPPPFEPPKGSAYHRWVAQVGRQAAEALAHAHRRGVIHRDVKPSNLLVDARGTIWVADFGLARRLADPGLTRADGLLGTPRYMSPEQTEPGAVDGRSDVYSLGATLYELLTLYPPFEGETAAELIQQIRHREPSPPRRLDPRIPRDLETIVLKAMARRPADRYATAADLAADLERFLDYAPVRARRIGPLGRLWRASRRNPALAAVSTTATVAVLATATVAYVRVVQQRDVAIRAHDSAIRAYRNQLLSEASVLRLSSVPNRRERGLERLQEAATLGPDAALRARLRDEAVRILILRDVEEERPTVSTGRVQGVAFGPEGTTLATLSDDGADLGLWDLARGERLAAQPLRAVAAVATTKPAPDRGPGTDRSSPRIAAAGRFVAVIGADGRSLRLVDAATGDPAGVLPPSGRDVVALLSPPSGRRPSAPAIPCGPRLVAIERGRDGFQVVLWDLEHPDAPERTPIGPPIRPTGPGRAPFPLVAVGPCGDLIAVARPGDVNVSIWSAPEEEPVTVDAGVQPSAVALGPDGLLAVAGDGVIKLWQVGDEPPRPLPGLSPHHSFVHRLRFSPGGALLAVAGRGPSVELWDLAANSLVATLPTPEWVNALDFTPDGRLLAAAGPAAVSLWAIVEPAGRVRLPAFGDAPRSLAFGPDGMLAVALASGGLRTWGPDCGPAATQPWVLSGPAAVTFDALGRLITLDSRRLSALPSSAPTPAPESADQIALPPPDDRGPPRPSRPRPAAELSRTADGRTLFLTRQDRAWVTRLGPSGELGRVQPLALPEPAGPGRGRDGMSPPWRGVAASPTGDRLYLVNVADEFVACALDGNRARPLEWNAVPEKVTALALSPDGAILALGGRNGDVALLNTADGSLRARLPRPADEAEGGIRALAIAPDGSTLAVGTREQVLLWSLADPPEPLVRLPGHRGVVHALAFDASGRRLATGGEDRLVEVWDLDRIRRELGRLGLGW